MISSKTSDCYLRGQLTFFYKDQVVNISVFVGYMASLATIQLWHYNGKAVKDNM